LPVGAFCCPRAVACSRTRLSVTRLSPRETMARLTGRNALVTGASRGIGRAIALQLASEGARVALNYRSGETEARQVAEAIGAAEGQCFLARADVSDPQQARSLVARVLEQWGRLDILVNNAGITRDKSLRKLTDQDWVEVI